MTLATTSRALSWSATALCMLGMIAIACSLPMGGWIARLLGDSLWIVWALHTRPAGFSAVVVGEGVFLVIDLMALSRLVLET